MWCECCKADVAAELSSDHRRFSCTRCGMELGHAVGASSRPVMPRVADSERDARELLARWSAMSVLEPLQHAPPSDAPMLPMGAAAASTVRVEPARVIVTETTVPHETEPATAAVEPAPAPHHKRHRRDAAAKTVRLPQSSEPLASRTISWSQLAGHLAAYGGVGLLSIGMTLVIWSYFGGPLAYAPTGWLLTTVGQMLLYLGVVTLVASGLEQTTDAVTLQMRQMGEKIERLESESRRTRRAHLKLRDAA